jgi:hypothetical protein
VARGKAFSSSAMQNMPQGRAKETEIEAIWRESVWRVSTSLSQPNSDSQHEHNNSGSGSLSIYAVRDSQKRERESNTSEIVGEGRAENGRERNEMEPELCGRVDVLILAPAYILHPALE